MAQKRSGAGIALLLIVWYVGLGALTISAANEPNVQAVASPLLCSQGERFTHDEEACRVNDQTSTCINFFCQDEAGHNRFPWRLAIVWIVIIIAPFPALFLLGRVQYLLGKQREGSGLPSPGQGDAEAPLE